MRLNRNGLPGSDDDGGRSEPAHGGSLLRGTRPLTRINRGDAAAFAGVALYCCAALISGTILDMSWAVAGWKLAFAPVSLLAIAGYYACFRPDERRLFEITFYAGLWLALPLAGTRLTFIANAANFPLQSELFFRMDRAIGFDWKAWADFVLDRPILHWATTRAYESYAWQPFAVVIALAIFGPARRNANFIVATMTALGMTIAVSTFVPAIEPGYFHGFDTPAAEAMLALRDGQRSDLRYIGILCFPSFHSAMAVLFTFACRGVRFLILPATVLNGLMLLSIPFSGDHYLVDLFAGVAVALAAQWLAGRILDERDIEAQDYSKSMT